MTAKECANNVGGKHVFPLDALSAVSALSDEFLTPLARFTFIRTLLDIRRSYRNRIYAEVVNVWKTITPDTGALKDAALITNEEHRKIYTDMCNVLSRSKTDGGYGYCDDCAGRILTDFCTLPWLKERG